MFNLIEENRIAAYTTILTLSEVLILPYKEEKIELVQKFLSFFDENENIKLTNVDKNITIQTAKLRAKYHALRAFDAVQLATAINNKCNAFITNDIRLKNISEIEIIILKDYL